jgi:hypothetical protein
MIGLVSPLYIAETSKWRRCKFLEPASGGVPGSENRRFAWARGPVTCNSGDVPGAFIFACARLMTDCLVLMAIMMPHMSIEQHA